MEKPLSRVSWRDVFWSTVVIAAGWTLAMSLWWLVGLLPWSYGFQLLIGVALAGMAIGATQWLVTARRFSASAWWILACGVGWSVALWCGFYFGDILVPHPLVMGGAGGLIVGAMQWVTFRRHLERAGWWVPLSIIVSLTSCWIGVWSGVNVSDHFNFNISAAYLVGGAVCGVVSGFLTGVALRWLTRGSR